MTFVDTSVLKYTDHTVESVISRAEHVSRGSGGFILQHDVLRDGGRDRYQPCGLAQLLAIRCLMNHPISLNAVCDIQLPAVAR